MDGRCRNKKSRLGHFKSEKETVRQCFLFSNHLIVATRSSSGKLHLVPGYGKIPLQEANLIEDPVEGNSQDDDGDTSVSSTSSQSSGGSEGSGAMSNGSGYPKTEDLSSREANLDFKIIVEQKNSPSLNIHLVAPTMQEKQAWISDIIQCLDNVHFNNLFRATLTDTSSVTMPHCIKNDPRLFRDDIDIRFSRTLNSCKVPHIRYATPERLLERLTDLRFLSIDFLNTFLLTYRVFSDGVTVLEALKKVFYNPDIPEQSDSRESSTERSPEDVSSPPPGIEIGTESPRRVSTASAYSEKGRPPTLQPLQAVTSSRSTTSKLRFREDPVKYSKRPQLKKGRKKSLRQSRSLRKEIRGRRCCRCGYMSPALFKRTSDSLPGIEVETHRDRSWNVETQLAKGASTQHWRWSHRRFEEEQRTQEERRAREDSLAVSRGMCQIPVPPEDDEIELQAVTVKQPSTDTQADESPSSSTNTSPLTSKKMVTIRTGDTANFLQIPEVVEGATTSSSAETLIGEDKSGSSPSTPPHHTYLMLVEDVEDDDDIEFDEESKLKTSEGDPKNSEDMTQALDEEKPAESQAEVSFEEKGAMPKGSDEMETRPRRASRQLKPRSSSPPASYLSTHRRSLPRRMSSLDEKSQSSRGDTILSGSDPEDDLEGQSLSVSSRRRSSGRSHSGTSSLLFVNTRTRKRMSTESDMGLSSLGGLSSPRSSVYTNTPRSSFQVPDSSQHSVSRVGVVITSSRQSQRRSSSASAAAAFAVATAGSSNPRDLPKTSSLARFSIASDVRRPSFKDRPYRQESIISTAATMRVLNVLRHWVSKHWQDFESDSKLCHLTIEFLEDLVCCPTLLPAEHKAASQLLRLITNEEPSTNKINLDALLTPPPTPCKENIESLSALDIAEQMTYIDHQIFVSIRSEEFLKTAWIKADKHIKAPHISLMTKRFNEMSRLVVSEIVRRNTLPTRISVIEKWVAVADICRVLHNYNGVLQVCSAFQSSSVFRLKKTWEKVSKTTKQTLSKLQSLVCADGRFRSLRDALHRCDPPCIPYLGMYLTDLSFIEEGTPNFTDDGLLNFSKMRMVAHVIREVRHFQQTPYKIDHVPRVASFLLDSSLLLTDDGLYKLSLEMEPRRMTLAHITTTTNTGSSTPTSTTSS